MTLGNRAKDTTFWLAQKANVWGKGARKTRG
jgi:hypothetical protein